jgi:hypothetical protein
MASKIPMRLVRLRRSRRRWDAAAKRVLGVNLHVRRSSGSSDDCGGGDGCDGDGVGCGVDVVTGGAFDRPAAVRDEVERGSDCDGIVCCESCLIGSLPGSVSGYVRGGMTAKY